MKPTIRVKKTHPNAVTPQYHTDGSAAFDFHLVEDVTIPPGGIEKARTGLVIDTPDHHVLVISSRSSSPLKKGVSQANGIGVIDSDYNGPNDEISLILHNLTDKPVHLKVGDRVSQGFIVPVIQVGFEEVEEMDGENRGGLGSTGR